MSEEALLEALDRITGAVVLVAKTFGTRVSRPQMCERLGICSKTLTERVRSGVVPAPEFDGKWLLWRLVEWEMVRIAEREALGETAEPEPEIDNPIDEPGFHLYRHFDKAGVLLYVGVSLSALVRLAAHGTNSVWFDQIARVEISNWATREASLRAERRAIRTENPLYNIQHSIRRVA